MINPKVSIIIPIFNAEAFLNKCIESIFSQSYHNIELILVNDGSSDRSIDICKDYADKDSRIVVKDIPNGGASHARNIGLDCVSGDFIWFVDADDWVDANALEGLIPEMKDDILFFGFKRIFSDRTEVCQISQRSNFHISDIDEWLSSLFKSKDAYFGFTWNKLFRKDIIINHNIRFNETLIIKEDEVFTLEYCKHIKNISISSKTPYNYRILGDSVSHSRGRKKNMLQLAYIVDNLSSTLKFGTKMDSALIQATSQYYFEAIAENLSKDDIDQIINQYFLYNRRNSDKIKLPLKRKLLYYFPNRYLRNYLIKKYLNLTNHVY